MLHLGQRVARRWGRISDRSEYWGGIRLPEFIQRHLAPHRVSVARRIDRTQKKLSSNAGPSPTITQKLRDLQELRKDGVITEADFEKKKQLLLEGM